MIAQKYIDRFWNKVDRRGPDDCWEWRGAHDTFGYGNFYYGRYEKAHRFSYLLAYGDIPKGMQVCHKCDNPRCVNPKHFFLGTLSENIKDMWNKGRGYIARGEKSNSAKLTEAQVREIRQAYKPHVVTEKMLAKKYGVGMTIINSIIHRKKWSHLD